MDHSLLPLIAIARKNWTDWRDVYEHSGSVESNPLLAEPGIRFGSFCKEYSVHRTIRAGTQNEFRQALATSPAFGDTLRDGSGAGIDTLEPTLRVRFGTHDPPRRMISVLSKVAAFLNPERFVAWDQYARKGVNFLLGRSVSYSFASYADYLTEFDAVWNGEHGKWISDFVINNDLRNPVESQSRFLRRVLDVYAMKCGGRWPE